MAVLSYLANPHRFMAFSRIALPIMSVLALIILTTGAIWGLFYAPAELYQGDSARIMFVHVPAAWLASMAYLFMAVAGLVYFVWRHNLADLAAKSAALPGAVFTALALITGAIWGKPTWGAYWVWDARITSMLVLFFLFLGYLALRAALGDDQRAGRASAILALVGTVNLVIIRYSVEWWNTLHQPASVGKTRTLPTECVGWDDPAAGFSEAAVKACESLAALVGKPAMPMEFLLPLLYMAFGASLLFGALVLTGMRMEVYRRRGDVLLARKLGAAL